MTEDCTLVTVRTDSNKLEISEPKIWVDDRAEDGIPPATHLRRDGWV